MVVGWNYTCILRIIGVSLSEPRIDHDNGPARRIMLSIYLSVAPWFPRSVYALKYSMYSSILTCSRA